MGVVSGRGFGGFVSVLGGLSCVWGLGLGGGDWDLLVCVSWVVGGGVWRRFAVLQGMGAGFFFP